MSDTAIIFLVHTLIIFMVLMWGYVVIVMSED